MSSWLTCEAIIIHNRHLEFWAVIAGFCRLGYVRLGFGVPSWSLAGFRVNSLAMKFVAEENGQVSDTQAQGG